MSAYGPRLLAALIAGSVIGIEGEIFRRAAGLRTTILVMLGTTLFAIGLVHLVALAGQIAGTAASSASCAKDPYCMNEDWSLLISGPILGTVGLSLTIPGISLMVSGYGFPRDVQPGRPDLTYVK